MTIFYVFSTVYSDTLSIPTKKTSQYMSDITGFNVFISATREPVKWLWLECITNMGLCYYLLTPPTPTPDSVSHDEGRVVQISTIK